jgi:hypothetical protein
MTEREAHQPRQRTEYANRLAGQPPYLSRFDGY